MEDNVGRTRQGRASRAHSSARKELAANVPPTKRGHRGRQGPPVRETHDAEAGGSHSRARRPVHDDDEFDAEESYPGGPRDLSLLKNYHKHQAIPIWDAQPKDPILNKSLRCIASANKGKFLNHVKISRPDGAQMLSTYLGIDEGDALDMFAILKGPYLTYSYVKGLVKDYLDTAETAFANNAPMHEVRMYRERCVRAFLLFVVGCTIFSNKSSYYLDVVYIQYFADLSSVHEWNWGSAALVHLQNYLDYASQAGSSQLAGYMSLFEGWIITHFPTLSMWQLETNFTENMPLNAKFAPGQGHKDSRSYRQSIDNIQVSDVVFSRYDNRRHVRPLIDVWHSKRPRYKYCKPGYVLWFYKVSHPKMRPLEAPEDQPRPPELEVLLEESQERRDPNPLGICRSVRDEVERALDGS
ncbi:hypothetical protein TSUD_331770 [Trifolium subterraneum]|uniref:Aminotransferase-like plant mobile domain-containing protein n=1 Tax=Trifolium subterraneum TaxID=3900 RepID=A0A2Z6MW90_TRISU|nr:hypothetical protein TSUD_331770 [Trifolium subterraneum]